MTKAEKTRNFIVEKTAPIFNMKGYAGTSLNDITAATGLTKGSIYGNFANKDEVALAAFDYNLKNVSSRIDADMNKQVSVKDKLLVYINIYQKFIDGSVSEGGCPVLNTAVDADDTHPELREKVLKAVLGWKNKIAKLVESGISTKEINADHNPEQVALTIIAIIEGGIMISRLTAKPAHWNLIMDSLKKYINSLG
ncbi:TetR/AcrR family transcriptional regulator [Pedobacter sp. ISL-68]|uniref:TetR/AcrR family transcriptional regulator n=1 Tax=unclassified Pedobacter TaxID=2628915 RepID=UPI001BEC37EF|nr:MULTISPECIES: TetR/AcrR family transcriptional regulator [unclassified Pedobacter]MBT2562099.1 TetR/AcrR family transcriptional regulator [Pedobacter sp. ISL-64]MBT2591686.1 TetR/AcrR family transcriptional regulator [Pedobacter sp. ISL-68]